MQTALSKLLDLTRQYRIKKEKNFKMKLNFLTFRAYDYYLNVCLFNETCKNNVDFPIFMYKRHFIILDEAMSRARQAVKKAEMIYGKKHIEHCFEREYKIFAKTVQLKKTIISNLYEKKV